MERNVQTGWRAGAAAVAALLACAGPAGAGEPVDIRESWDGAGVAGWTNTTHTAALSNPGGYLRFTHPPQSKPAFAEDIARFAITPGVRVTNACLRFTSGATIPSTLRLCLHAALSGRLWYRFLPTPPAGQTLDACVPVTAADGAWRTGPNSPVASFEADIGLADWFGVAVVRNADTAEQDYDIDEVRLQGVYTADVDGDGMSNAWEIAYSLDPESDADRNADPDGDGMGNYGEYRSGTGPRDADSVLRVRMSQSGAGGVTLSWPSADGRTYALWSTTNLCEQLAPVDSGIPAEPGTNRYPLPSSASSGIFRVGVE